jgi:cysteine-rich repeat protein
MRRRFFQYFLFLNAGPLFFFFCFPAGCSKTDLKGANNAFQVDTAQDDEFDTNVMEPDAVDAETEAEGVGDSIVDGEFAPSDSIHDVGFDWESIDTHHEELPPLPYVPQCGNGVLDEGEECDDRNRLDGDGCDWLCRSGDGDPPPEPDPDVEPYVPAGDPTVMPGTFPTGWSLYRLPVVWTGSEFATAFDEHREDDSNGIRFRRFSFDGDPLDADWVYETENRGAGVDLVWIGSGFGLFFVDVERGLFFMPLSYYGKPLGPPVLVEPDPQARAPAADLALDGFVLAWITEGSSDVHISWCGEVEGPSDTIRLRRVGFDGSTHGPPVMIEEMAGGPPGIAAGEDGFGVSMMVNSSVEFPSCAFRFARLSGDLTDIVYSGILSDGLAGDLGWIDGHYRVAWPYRDTMEGGREEQCVARYSSEGWLESSPVCTDVTAFVADQRPTRLAAGRGGLTLVFASDGDGMLSYLRTDMNGRAVDIPRSVTGEACRPVSESFCHFRAYGTTWTDDGFAVLFIATINDWGISNEMMLQHFLPVD